MSEWIPLAVVFGAPLIAWMISWGAAVFFRWLDDLRRRCGGSACRRKRSAAQLIPSDYLMPYCTCPKCKTEALHWMRAANPNLINERKFSCIRTCRHCMDEWGQNTITETMQV